MISIYIAVESTTLGNKIISIQSFAPEKYGIATFHGQSRTTLVFWSLHFDSYLGKFYTQLLLILNVFPLRLRKTVSLATTPRPKTFQHLIKNLPLTYKQCQEENTIKKYQQYLKTWKEWATAHQVCLAL